MQASFNLSCIKGFNFVHTRDFTLLFFGIVSHNSCSQPCAIVAVCWWDWTPNFGYGSWLSLLQTGSTIVMILQSLIVHRRVELASPPSSPLVLTAVYQVVWISLFPLGLPGGLDWSVSPRFSSFSCSWRKPLRICGIGFMGQMPFLLPHQQSQNSERNRDLDHGLEKSPTSLILSSSTTGLLGHVANPRPVAAVKTCRIVQPITGAFWRDRS